MTAYLRQQHRAACLTAAQPVSVVPPVSLLKPYSLPVATRPLSAPANVTLRLSRQQVWGGFGGRGEPASAFICIPYDHAASLAGGSGCMRVQSPQTICKVVLAVSCVLGAGVSWRCNRCILFWVRVWADAATYSIGCGCALSLQQSILCWVQWCGLALQDTLVRELVDGCRWSCCYTALGVESFPVGQHAA